MGRWLESRIEGEIHADELIVGKGVVVEPGVLITGKGGPARKVVLGDFSFIGRGSRILCPEFMIGDYSKLNQDAFCHGKEPLRIGRNCWFGGGVVLDSMGGLDIDDGVGVGAGSQLWTHAQFGDVVEGCRFHSYTYMHVGKDAWIVGHCIISPVRIEPKAMALAGSVVTRDLLENRVYGGVPAKDLTDKVGPQFDTIDVPEKAVRMQKQIDGFLETHPQFAGQLAVVQSLADAREGITSFDVSSRQYTQTYSEAEVAFLKATIPLVKFTPVGKPTFYTASAP